ncbi:hypothetical protein CQW23_22019 [Capsicum baccatum]|uniref:Uncharacterized protein n=1 Tax=Capsicum baccatum TaxID=33114 RepID=A0A2G2VZP1_CAPBA|nr:hypothetical protein CQW23_22019 [Capsicum baccatum]
MATTTKKNKNFLFLGGKDKITPLPSCASTLQFEFDEAEMWSNSEETHYYEPKLSIPRRKSTKKEGKKVINATSLPVNVPDWRKILGDDKGNFGKNIVYNDDDDDGDYDNENKIPPHEYLARTRVASFSVHEGIGRTLKGRDMSRVQIHDFQTNSSSSISAVRVPAQRLVRKKENNMGRKQMFLVLGLVMVMGLAVYLRLWTIDYHFSSTETELLRRQFDLASREAMDESAMWRKRFDDEEDKSSTCQKELNKRNLDFCGNFTLLVQHAALSVNCLLLPSVLSKPD